MVKVSIKVKSGTASFRVAVQAENVERALSLVVGRYPASTGRVAFPMEAEDFSLEGLTARARMQPEKLAA